MSPKYSFRWIAFHRVKHVDIVKNRQVLTEIDKIVRGSKRMSFLEMLLNA